MTSIEYFDDDQNDTGPTDKMDKNLLANLRAWLQRHLNQIQSKFKEGEEQFWGEYLMLSSQDAPYRGTSYDSPAAAL